MDTVIQKCTEIGASAFQPVITRFSIVKPNQHEKQIERWSRIALEAVKQSERCFVPPVYEILEFDEYLEGKSEQHSLFLDAREKENSRITLRWLASDKGCNNVNVFIGPEGGFSDEEKEKLKKAGFISLNLGPRILRTETVGPIITALLLYEFEN
jgi:16S rRNA (uracil1498-N3)-methyltransferase